MKRPLGLASALLLSGCGNPTPIDASPNVFDLGMFRSAPRETAPHVRWWWPGGAVDDDVIVRELEAIRDAGFGGVELQAFAAGLSPADLAADPAVRTVGSPAYVEHVRTFLRHAERRGLTTTLTLGSGWPSGGALSVDVRPMELLRAEVDLVGPLDAVVPVPTPVEPDWVAWTDMVVQNQGPFVGPFELHGVYLLSILDATVSPVVADAPVDVTGSVVAGELRVTVPQGPHRAVFVFRHRVDHGIVAHAFPEAPPPRVIDHMDPDAFARLRAEQLDPFFDSLAPDVPDEVFVDSFELVGELPWTSALGDPVTSPPQQFGAYLPFLFRKGGESFYREVIARSPPAYTTPDDVSVRVREDYEDARAAHFRDGFLLPVAEFARDHGVNLRLQAHGGYEQVLDAFTYADIPESEGLFAQGSFDFLALASSAAHVAGRRYVASESFVTINAPSTRLSEGELWGLAGRAFAAGINRPVFHGLAYPYLRSDGRRYYPFVADPSTGNALGFTADFDLADPEFAYLPAFNAALARLGYAMSRGTPAIDVAWVLGEREIPNGVAIHFDSIPPEEGESEISLAIRRAGRTYDRISHAMLGGTSAGNGAYDFYPGRYRVLVLSDVASLNPEELRSIGRALDEAIPPLTVFVVGDLPSRARGYLSGTGSDAQTAAAVAQIRPRVHVVADAAALRAALETLAPVPYAPPGGPSDCVTVSRRVRSVGGGLLVFVFHEYEEACTATFAFPLAYDRVTTLDPLTGRAIAVSDAAQLSVDLPGRRPRLLFVERRR